MIKQILALTPALLMLGACQQAPKRDFRFIENPTVYNTDPKKPLTAQEVDYDLDQVIYALQNGYSGSQYLPGQQFETLLKQLRTIHGPLTAQNLCDRIAEDFAKVSDNHLRAKLDFHPCLSQSEDYAGRVGANFNPSTDNPWRVGLKKRGKKSALVIGISNFPSRENPVWNGFLEEVRKQLPRANFIIVDMRGNGGGDDGKGYELAHLLAGNHLKAPYSSQFTRQTPEAYQLQINGEDYGEKWYLRQKGTIPPHMEKLKEGYLAQQKAALAGKAPPEMGKWDESSDEFDFAKSVQKPIYILIDRGCASSCESSTDAFEFLKLATTVGEQTAGYIHFGNVGMAVLKNSGVAVQMATTFNNYFDHRYLEKKGLQPKIQVPPGSDAMDAAWTDYLRR